MAKKQAAALARAQSEADTNAPELLKKNVSMETEVAFLQAQIQKALEAKKFPLVAQLSQHADFLVMRFSGQPTRPSKYEFNSGDPLIERVLPDYSLDEYNTSVPFLLIKDKAAPEDDIVALNSLPDIIPRPPAIFKTCSLVGINDSTIQLESINWPNAVTGDGCATNYAACRMLSEDFGLQTPFNRCSSHTADGTLKRLAKSKTMNIPEVTTLYDALRSVMSHIVCSPKSTSLLKDSIAALDLPEVHILNWCSTRMGGFLKCCEKFSSLIVALYDTLVSAKVKEDQTAVLMTPVSTYLIFLLSDLSKNHFQKYLHTVDSDSTVVSEVHGIAIRAADAFAEGIDTPAADRFIETLNEDEFGNLTFKITTDNEEHVLRLNYQQRGRRNEDALGSLQNKLRTLKTSVLQNIESNIRDQNKDTLASHFSCLDLDSTEDTETRLQNISKLWHTYGKDNTHALSEKYCDLNVTISYKRKVTCTLEQLHDEFVKAVPVLSRYAKRRREVAEGHSQEKVIPTQLSLLQEFVKHHEMVFFHLCQIVRIALSIATNTGWIERSYSRLQLICTKQRNKMKMTTMEVLYLLKELNLPMKESYVEELRLLEN